MTYHCSPSLRALGVEVEVVEAVDGTLLPRAADGRCVTLFGAHSELIRSSFGAHSTLRRFLN